MIAAYFAIATPSGVDLARCFGGQTQRTTAHTFEDAALWLTQAPAATFSVVWSLHDFTKALFTLLCPAAQAEIAATARCQVTPLIRVFSVPRFLGITASRHLQGNFYEQGEVNLYAIGPESWLVDVDDPATVEDVAAAGEVLLAALHRMGIAPRRLTSPVAVFSDAALDSRRMPTVWNFPDDKMEAMEYAAHMMRHEWREAFQVGHFPGVHLYDLVSAYPSIIADLPSTHSNYCYCEKADTPPSWAQWGIMRGTVEVEADVSPLVYGETETYSNPKGRWEGYFTTEEIAWLTKWAAGRFTMQDGFFCRFIQGRHPYREAIRRLYMWRTGGDPVVSAIAKRMAQGLSGKLDQDNQDGKLGDFYNPILAAMTRSRCRLKVADFIYRNRLTDSVVAVQVDGVAATQYVPTSVDGGMGAWRYEGVSPALVLGKGLVWRPGKRPQGISYEDLIAAIQARPDASYYEFAGGRRSVDLLLDAAMSERGFEQYPTTGGGLLQRPVASKGKQV